MAAKGITSLELMAEPLREMWEFYGRTLGLPVSKFKDSHFVVTGGETEITFYRPSAAGTQPFYHFAFNITENKQNSALEWLKKRTPVILNDGKLFHFASWNAHAMYFVDPAGNIGEFIARHDLKHGGSGPFGLKDILGVSEIGLVVDDVPATVSKARQSMGLEPYRGTSSNDFAAIGDEHALLILVERGRIWLPATLKKPAVVHHVEARLAGAKGSLKIAGHPYSIKGS